MLPGGVGGQRGWWRKTALGVCVCCCAVQPRARVRVWGLSLVILSLASFLCVFRQSPLWVGHMQL